ncbi:MAG: hypothetical protein HQL99_17325 [Magnetococcales bacterium]|nr:hypothetical protein [Magnetococcales bacterium]
MVSNMGFQIPDSGNFQAFAIIIDINSFTSMVSRADNDCTVAQYVRDVLLGAIESVENSSGHIVSFMGDAFLALLQDPIKVMECCVGISKSIDRSCEHISNAQADCNNAWDYAPGGPSVKITIEYGEICQSTIESNFLGSQKLFIGSAINYAARIGSAGEGNRCLLGPVAAKIIQNYYELLPARAVEGKAGESKYIYYQLDLGDIWREGSPEQLEESYWG